VIEPASATTIVTGVNNFADILRFDAADVLTKTPTKSSIRIVNSYLLPARMDPNVKDCDAQNMSNAHHRRRPRRSVPVPWESARAQHGHLRLRGPREVLSWEVGQKYFSIPPSQRSVVRSAQRVYGHRRIFTGVAFLDAGRRRFAPSISPSAH